jgi:ankyrin repeat protein
MLDMIRALFGGKPSVSPQVRLRRAVETSDTATVHKVIQAHSHLLNHQDEKGETPLHWAVEKQDLSVVAALVDLGADNTLKDKLGYTAAHLAHYHGEFRMGCYTDISKRIVTRIEGGLRKNNDAFCTYSTERIAF